MKRKIILIVLVFLFNLIWVNAISFTNELANKYHFVIKTNKTASNKNNIIDDLDVLLDTNLQYEDEDASIIGKKIDNYLIDEMDGYGELIAKYSIINEVNPYLVASMIIENTNCDTKCSVLVKQCNNVAKMLYEKDNISQASCFEGSYQKFNTIDDSIKNYIKFIKVKFYDNDLTNPGSIYQKYNKDVRWVFIINQYMTKIKNSPID